MDNRITAPFLLLIVIYAHWLYRALVLYRLIDAQHAGVLPTLHSKLQPLTDRASALAFIRFLCSKQSGALGAPAVHRGATILRLLAGPLILVWVYVLYLELHT
jgi:hypothetical protein